MVRGGRGTTPGGLAGAPLLSAASGEGRKRRGRIARAASLWSPKVLTAWGIEAKVIVLCVISDPDIGKLRNYPLLHRRLCFYIFGVGHSLLHVVC